MVDLSNSRSFRSGFFHFGGQTGTPGLNIGTFIAFNSAMGVFLGGVTSLSDTITDVIGIVPLWERAKSILDSPIEYNPNLAHPPSDF